MAHLVQERVQVVKKLDQKSEKSDLHGFRSK